MQELHDLLDHLYDEERDISSQVLEKLEYLSPFQLGVYKGKSTAITDLIDYVTIKLNINESQ